MSDDFVSPPVVYPNLIVGPDSTSETAMQLLQLYVPFIQGDSKFAEVCKDFGGSGTTCGFLCHWLMWRLGCRDPKIVNRSDPSSGLKYRIGMNIAMIYRGGGSPWVTMKPGMTPQPGDVCLVSNGPSSTEHVFVFVSQEIDIDGSIHWNTADAGQRDPSGPFVAAKWCRRKLVGNVLGDRKVMGWIPLAQLNYTEPCALQPPM